jgi:pyruvate formate lyase activating enzyme
MTDGNIFDIKRYAIHDGPGIRVTVFLKGCPLRCWWCHNPEGLESGIQEMDSAIAGEGREAIGRKISAEELMKEVEKDILFMEESCGGVTFSGGEPMMQSEFLAEALSVCRQKRMHTIVDTCGFMEFNNFERIIDLVDIFYYDLKLIDGDLHKKYTGVSNALIIENLKRLDAVGRRIVIRFPLIPGITDSDDNLEALANLVKSLNGKVEIVVLPYHKTAKGKYQRLGLEYKMKGIEPPSEERLLEVKTWLEGKGITIGTGEEI